MILDHLDALSAHARIKRSLAPPKIKTRYIPKPPVYGRKTPGIDRVVEAVGAGAFAGAVAGVTGMSLKQTHVYLGRALKAGRVSRTKIGNLSHWKKK